MNQRFRISFFGSSLVSAYNNDAATYYRGLIRALHERGHRVTFYEPDLNERQQHRDIPDPNWARVKVYKATDEAALNALEQAEESDVVIKCSGIGVNDELLEAAVLELKKPETLVAFLDADVPVKIDRIQREPDDVFRALIPEYDLILTGSGGQSVVDAYLAAGACQCVPLYSTSDPQIYAHRAQQLEKVLEEKIGRIAV
jgi:spore maturation protein CgeB